MVALLAALAVQAPTHLVGFYTGIPGLAASNGLSLMVQSHSATVQLYHQTATTQSVTVIKNLSAKGGMITLAIPNHVRQAGTMGAAHGADLDGMWDKTPLNISQLKWARNTTTNALVDADGYFAVQVKVAPSATHALRLSWTGDLLVSGSDKKSRTLAYDCIHSDDWQSFGQFKYSIQYRNLAMPGATEPLPSPVFAIEGLVPSKAWQTGSKGAFLESIPTSGTVFFSFHPNSYGGR